MSQNLRKRTAQRTHCPSNIRRGNAAVQHDQARRQRTITRGRHDIAGNHLRRDANAGMSLLNSSRTTLTRSTPLRLPGKR